MKTPFFRGYHTEIQYSILPMNCKEIQRRIRFYTKIHPPPKGGEWIFFYGKEAASQAGGPSLMMLSELDDPTVGPSFEMISEPGPTVPLLSDFVSALLSDFVSFPSLLSLLSFSPCWVCFLLSLSSCWLVFSEAELSELLGLSDAPWLPEEAFAALPAYCLGGCPL